MESKNNEFSRLQGESDEELILRVCSNKKKIGTWDDVAKILNGLLGKNYCESRYRKLYTNKKMEDKYSEDSFEKQVERKKLQTAKHEWNREALHQARFELFYENVRDEINRLQPINMEPLEPPKNQKQEYVLCFSDIHYGATFTSENNHYSRDVAKRRFRHMLGDVQRYIRKNDIKKLTVINLGDSIQGMIRLTDLRLNDVSTTQCVVEVSQLIAQFLNQLAKKCYLDYYHVPTSNHTQTRPLHSKSNELADEDVEKIIGNYIKDVLAENDRVKVHLSNKHRIELNLLGYNIICEHGNEIKNVKNYLKDCAQLHRKIFNYGIIGHFHAGQELVVAEDEYSNSEILTVPSFIGSDHYSDKLKVGAKPGAKIYEFTKENGHVGTKTLFVEKGAEYVE